MGSDSKGILMLQNEQAQCKTHSPSPEWEVEGCCGVGVGARILIGTASSLWGKCSNSQDMQGGSWGPAVGTLLTPRLELEGAKEGRRMTQSLLQFGPGLTQVFRLLDKFFSQCHHLLCLHSSSSRGEILQG